MIPFLPGLGWPQIIAAIFFLIGLALVLVSRSMRKKQPGGSPTELRLFVAGAAVCLVAAIVGWITL